MAKLDLLKNGEELKLFKQGKVTEALAQQTKENEQIYAADKREGDHRLLDLIMNKKVVSNRREFHHLQSERAQLLKIQDKVDDYKAFNSDFQNSALAGLKKTFGEKPPLELVEQVQNMVKEANLIGLRLENDSITQNAQSIIQGLNARVGDEVTKGNIPKAMLHAAETKKELQHFIDKGVLNKEEFELYNNKLKSNYSGLFLIGASNQVRETRTLEGYDEAYKTHSSLSTMLKPYLQDAPKPVQATWASVGNQLKAARDDSKSILANNKVRYSNGLKLNRPPSTNLELLQNNNKQLLKILSNRQTTPQAKIATKNNIRYNNGSIALNNSLVKAIKGFAVEGKLLKGVTPKQLATILNVEENSLEHLSALSDYQKLFTSFDKDDAAGSLYRMNKSLRGEEVEKITGITSLLNRAKDQEKVVGSIGKEVKSSIISMYNNPNLPLEDGARLAQYVKNNPETDLPKLIAKNYDTSYNKQTISFIAQNHNLFTNLDVSSPADTKAMFDVISKTPNAIASVNRIMNYIIGGGVEDLTDLATKHGTTASVIARSLALDIVAGNISGNAGSLGFDVLSSASNTQLEDLYDDRILDKIASLDDKVVEFGEGNYLSANEVQFMNLKSQASNYLQSFFTNPEDVGVAKKIFNFGKSAFSDKTGYSSLSVPYKKQITSYIKDLTGLKNAELLDRVRFSSDPVNQKMYLQVDNGENRSYLYYKDTNLPLSISFVDIQALTIKDKITEEGFVSSFKNLLKAGTITK